MVGVGSHLHSFRLREGIGSAQVAGFGGGVFHSGDTVSQTLWRDGQHWSVCCRTGIAGILVITAKKS